MNKQQSERKAHIEVFSDRNKSKKLTLSHKQMKFMARQLVNEEIEKYLALHPEERNTKH